MRVTRTGPGFFGSSTSRAALVAAMALMTLGSPDPGARAASDPLLASFQDPPSSARPRVWWHWMNGNITEDGIAKDMAWMKRVGIAGLQNFDAALSTPPIVENRLAFMTPEWKKAFRFAAAEADRNGLELAIAASPGWSETGGPWVAAEGRHEEARVERNRDRGRPALHRPSRARRRASRAPSRACRSIRASPAPWGSRSSRRRYYEDVAVLAVPVPAAGETAAATFSDGKGQPLDAKALTDGDLKTTIELPADGAAIVVAYPAPQTIRSASLFLPGGFVTFFGAAFAPRLEASDDGQAWRKVSEIPASETPSTVSFAPVTGVAFPRRVPPQSREGATPCSGFPASTIPSSRC